MLSSLQQTYITLFLEYSWNNCVKKNEVIHNLLLALVTFINRLMHQINTIVDVKICAI